ncbi:IclR family transcriptional regulator [Bordetella sp. 2513F-2]
MARSARAVPAPPARRPNMGVEKSPVEPDIRPALHLVAAGEHGGTQSIERALRILRELASRGEFGWRLSDLAARCEMDKGTAHRVLACLAREHFVQQRRADKRYFPGPMLFQLGLSLPGYAAFQHACAVPLARLARRTEAIAWLILRSGNDYVCAVREGNAALRGFLVQVGTRRPLFTSVGGAAILMTLPREEARAILDDNTRQEIAQRGPDRLPGLRQMLARSRRHGFGVNLGDVAPGLHAYAAPICGEDGRAFAALCLTGLADQLCASQIDTLRTMLFEVASQVEGHADRLLPPDMLPARAPHAR